MTRRYDIGAFYWPAYHDEPRWRRFFPQGEGEWATVRKARPRFEGHYQPRVPAWGYEDESNPRVMERKIDAAAQHGVNTFIFDWYWYDGGPFLEECLNEGFLGARNHAEVRFYLMWANHDATTLWDLEQSHRHEVVWPGLVDRADFENVVERVIDRYLTHPSYYRIDGKPVFAVYELSTLINGLGGPERTREALDYFRRRAREVGLPGVHLQAILWGRIPAGLSMVPGDRSETQDNTIAHLGFDSLTNYQWCHYVRPRGDYRDWAEKAVAAWEGWADEFSVPFFPHVSIGWDTNPRFREFREDLITGSTPEAFEEYLLRAMDYVERHGLSPRLITINAWNEWSESSYLEPDEAFGMRYLEAVRSAVASGASQAGELSVG